MQIYFSGICYISMTGGRRIRAKIYLALVEWSSLPVLVGIYVLFISGYGLITGKASWMTFGLMNRPMSILLHVVSPLPYIVGILTAIHSASGLGFLILKHVKNNLLGTLLEIINLIAAAYFVILLTALEFL